jgi:glycosyltransferase involved in cell wall biosynthesis
LKTWIQNSVPKVSGKVDVIYNPVDTTLFSPDANAGSPEEKLSLGDKRLALHVGIDYLVVRKGLHYAIKSLAKLPKDVTLIVIRL